MGLVGYACVFLISSKGTQKIFCVQDTIAKDNLKILIQHKVVEKKRQEMKMMCTYMCEL